MDFGKDKGDWFSNFAKAKKREPTYVDLANLFVIWGKNSVELEAIGRN